MMLRQVGRLALSHGPLLVAIYLGSVLCRYLLIQTIGYIGAYSAITGALLFPLFMLVQMFALVSMLLVMRDGLVELGAIAPRPTERSSRRAAFVDSLLGSVLAFVVLYVSAGYLRSDAQAYMSRVLETNRVNVANDVATGDGAIGELSVGPITLGIVVVAFGLRWAYGRYRERLPKGFAFVAVYLEAMWVVWSAMLLSQVFESIGAWVDSRQAVRWLSELREWVGAQMVPLAWLWDGVEWFLGESAGIIVQPLAWLAIAGVVFGYAVKLPPLRMKVRRIDAIRLRYGRVPSRLRRRLNDFWGQFSGRFRPIWDALVLMWRAGPVLIGSYILLFTIVLSLQSLLGIAVTRLVGPLEIYNDWPEIYVAVLLVVPLVVEPLRLIVVASAYDRVVGSVRAPAPTLTA